MSLLTKGVTRLSQLEIDVHKDWGGRRIENLGQADSEDDALSRGLAVLSAMLTGRGQLVYAEAAGVPAALDPPQAGRYLYHPGGEASPSWAPIAPGGLTPVASQTLAAPGAIDLAGIDTSTCRVLKLYLLVTAVNVSNHLRLTLQGDGGARYHVERVWASSGGVSQNQFQSQPYINLGLLGGESNVHKTFAEVTIFNPSDIDKLVLAHLSVVGQTSGNLFTNLTGGRYTSVTVETVTRITVTPDAGNLATGSRAWLYGVA